jgi:hypothetical protein
MSSKNKKNKNMYWKGFMVTTPIFLIIVGLLFYLKALAVDLFVPAFWGLEPLIMFYLFIYITVMMLYIGDD